MTLNTSEKWEGPLANSSPPCSWKMSWDDWEHQIEKMYTYYYLMLFIPGLLLNTMALWVLCKYISNKSKTVIFMMNLALADLAHILSLPLRIYYYFTHTWPFGRGMCLFCFYLKYLNMYAAIAFLVCISMQRCVFLLNPFYARRWRRRYEILISVTVWVFVSLGCSPFILMRSSTSNLSDGILTVSHNTSLLMDATSTLHPLSYTSSYTPPLNSNTAKPTHATGGCFKDLPMRRLSVSLAVTMMALAELFGFVIPLVCISYSSIRITWSLYQRQAQDQQTSNVLNSAARSRLQSVSSNGQLEKCSEKQANAEKQRALLMVLSCFILFLVCFVPYHLNFLLYLMVSQGIVSHCTTEMTVRKFHPVSLCLANLSCCLNPLLYYFLTAEFRQHLTRRVSSFTSSLLSSPISSPTQRLAPHRMMSMESSCSDRDEHN